LSERDAPDRPPPAVAALGWGLAGGLLGLFPCCFLWAPAALTGWLAAHHALRLSPGEPARRVVPRAAALAALVTGVVGGAVSTAAFLGLRSSGGEFASLLSETSGAIGILALGWAGDAFEAEDGAFAYGILTAAVSAFVTVGGGLVAGALARPTPIRVTHSSPIGLPGAPRPAAPVGDSSPRPVVSASTDTEAATATPATSTPPSGPHAQPDAEEEAPTVRDERDAWK
jgi:hypothetical protein